VSWLGRHTSLHNTSNGKVFLAHLDPEEIEEVLSQDLVATTEHTITDPDRLREQLATIRELGYAWQYEELEPGLCAVAAPIHDSLGGVLATVSVAGPSFRMTEERVPELGRLTVEAAASVSRRLGFVDSATG
jgi:DNA-binding IclR family transcriptional regulator